MGAYLRAATENPKLVQAFGINVPVMITVTYAIGVGLAGLAGVLAAPATQISPLMGSNLIIVVFAVVVIGGMGSILGSIVTGLGLGLIEGLTKVFYSQAANTVVFLIMAWFCWLDRLDFSARRDEITVNAPLHRVCIIAGDWARRAFRGVSDFPDARVVLRSLCLRLQSPARLHGIALVWPRSFLRHRGLRHGDTR